MKKILFFIGLCMVASYADASQPHPKKDEYVLKVPTLAIVKQSNLISNQKDSMVLLFPDGNDNDKVYSLRFSVSDAKRIPLLQDRVSQSYTMPFVVGTTIIMEGVERRFTIEDVERFGYYIGAWFDWDEGKKPGTQKAIRNFVQGQEPYHQDNLRIFANHFFQGRYPVGLLELPDIGEKSWLYPDMKGVSIIYGDKKYRLPLEVACQLFNVSVSNTQKDHILSSNWSPQQIDDLIAYAMRRWEVRENDTKLLTFVQGLPPARQVELKAVVQQRYKEKNPIGFPSSIFSRIKDSFSSLFAYTKKECRSFGSACWYRNTKRMKDIIFRNGKVIGGMALVAAVLLYAKFAK